MDFDQLPKLETFENVKWKDRVYSPTLGLGFVVQVYRDDELIVVFPGRKVRISLDDSDLCLVPIDLTTRKRSTNRMVVNGVAMGRTKMKKYMKENI